MQPVKIVRGRRRSFASALNKCHRRGPSFVLQSICLLVLLFLGAGAATTAGQRVRFTLESEYQPGRLSVDVLVPDRIPQDSRLKVVYVLPVEPLQEHRYGSGLDVIEQLDLQNQYQVIFVSPTFGQMPWYADHPSDPQRRQESFFVHVVVPSIESRFPVLKEPQGRLLVGFSKSGWGAYSLLLRYPDMFGGAAAWDAPLARFHPDSFEMPDSFGTQENFDHYYIFSLLVERGKQVGDTHRLVILGYGLFRSDVSKTHVLMRELGIRHVYSNKQYSKHVWDAGWLLRAVSLLLSTKRK